MKEKEAFLHHLINIGDNEAVIQLIDSGDVDVNAKNEKGDTAIHKAVIVDNVELLKKLIESGADINVVNNDLSSSLHIATECAAINCIRFLLTMGITVNRLNNKKQTEMIVANNIDNSLQEKRNEIIGILIDYEPMNLTMIVENETFMHYACRSGNLFLVEKLIQKQTDLHKPNGSADFPIHNAAMNGHNDIIISLLENIETLDVNIRGERSQTSLHYAINYANLSTIELLISHGANCNLLTNDGYSCLHSALQQYFKCCSKSKKSDCDKKHLIEDCSQIKEIYEKSMTVYKKKCIFMAVAIYLIDCANANIHIKITDGTSPIETVNLNDDVAYYHLKFLFEKSMEQKIIYRPLIEVLNKISEKVNLLASTSSVSLFRENNLLKQRIAALECKVDQLMTANDDEHDDANENAVEKTCYECGCSVKYTLLCGHDLCDTCVESHNECECDAHDVECND